MGQRYPDCVGIDSNDDILEVPRNNVHIQHTGLAPTEHCVPLCKRVGQCGVVCIVHQMAILKNQIVEDRKGTVKSKQEHSQVLKDVRPAQPATAIQGHRAGDMGEACPTDPRTEHAPTLHYRPQVRPLLGVAHGTPTLCGVQHFSFPVFEGRSCGLEGRASLP